MQTIPLTYIIDDDPIFLVIAEKMLKKNPAFVDVKTFSDGQEGIQQLHSDIKQQKQLPTLILLDINMPVLDGWGFLEAYQKLPIAKGPKIFICTSSIDLRDRNQAKSYTAVSDMLSKPLTKEMVDHLARHSMGNTIL
jgi:CheY-like chemotaxis protein